MNGTTREERIHLPREFYSVKDAAYVCDTSERVIRQALDSGQLEAHLWHGRGFPKIWREDLILWATSQPLYEPKALR